MKKISMFFVVLITLCAYLSGSVFALSVMPDYNAATGDLTLNGTADGIVSVRITSDAASDGLLSKDNLPIVYYQFEAEGSYNVTLRLPSAHRTGKYTVYVTDLTGSERKTIICYDKGVADALVDTVSALDDAAFVEEMTKEENIKKLGIDVNDTDYSTNTISIMSKLYSSYADSNDFKEKYNYCKALNSLLGKDKAGIEASLLKYEAILGIDYDVNYRSDATLTNDVKQNLCNVLSQMDYASNISYAESLTDKTGFEAYLKAASALAGAKTYEDWAGLQKLYTKDYAFLKTKIVDANSDYSKCEPSAVFGELNKQSFLSLSDLGTKFNAAVAAVKPGVNAPQGPAQLPANPSKPAGNPTVSIGGGSVGGGSFETLPSENTAAAKLSYSLPELSMGNAYFSDINDTDWFKNSVSALSNSGIINGYNDGSFKPQNYITRAEFTKLVASAFSINSEKTASFEDVPDDAWYTEYINDASGAGIITGFDGKFNPESYITRQDAAVMMGRIAKLFCIEYAGYKAFDDMENVSLYAVTTVGAFYSNGILNGNGEGAFSPLDSITRAEASQLIYNLVSDMITRS